MWLLLADLITRGEKVTVSVIDLLGRNVKSQVYNTEAGKNVLEFDSKTFPAGTYIYKVTSIEKETKGEIIINKN